MSPASARPLTVLDQHNAVFQIPARMAGFSTNPIRRLALLHEARKLADCEVRTCSEFDRVVFVTDEDKQALSGQGLRQRDEGHLSVIPIGTELDPLPVRDLASKQVLFVGGMHWPPNAEGIQWFAREAWPLIRRHCGEARLVVLGKNPPQAIRALGDPSIEIAGFVEEITGYLARTAVTVVPLFSGGGMRVKILEAWARGIPVVSTRVGAEGLSAEPGRNILFAETAAEFGSAVQRVLNDATLASELACCGLHTVQAHYDWEKEYQAWDEVYGCESSLLSHIHRT
jgi:glycosyltransferase involved in cell wall biosynthesis